MSARIITGPWQGSRNRRKWKDAPRPARQAYQPPPQQARLQRFLDQACIACGIDVSKLAPWPEDHRPELRLVGGATPQLE